MRVCLGMVLWLALSCHSAQGAFIVIANYTTDAVAFSIGEPGEKVRHHTIAAYNVLPFTVTAPGAIQFTGDQKGEPIRIEPFTAYAFMPDQGNAVRVIALELPGKQPERDARPELNPIARKPVTIPVTLFVDEVDPRADKLWHKEVKDRFDAAAQILESQTGFHLEFTGFGTWASDGRAKDIRSQLVTFEKEVNVKAGGLAIGYTSQKLDDKQKVFGDCRGLGSSHIILREWKPRGEPERIEVLVRYMAIALGAVTSPDPGSAMRAQLGDGKALHTKFVVRLDPLNVLVLNLLADQRRQGISSLDRIPVADRARIARVYSGLLEAYPGESLAIDYLELLNKEVAKGADPKGPGLPKKGDLALNEQAKRLEAVRTIVRAVTRRAQENAGPAALTGDQLTLALIKAAADSAQGLEEANRNTALLLGLAVALDDSAALRDDPITASAIAAVESAAERQERLAVLGNPTLHGRRDLCRRFAAGCATGELLAQSAAENSAINRSLFELGRPDRPSGLSYPALMAEFAGISLASSFHDHPELLLQKLRGRLHASDLVPATEGLRDGIGPEKFEDDFGGVNDERFQAMISDIRKRLQARAIQQSPR